MGVYGQGGSNNAGVQDEPVMGHPVFPPPASQIQMPAVETKSAGEWNATLCGCCGDCDVCCQTCWCPCVTFGQIAEIVSEEESPCPAQTAVYALLCSVGIACCYSFSWRQRLRTKFGLEKGCCGDFCVHCCCELCALCQEHRELQTRGMNPSLGWEGVRFLAPVPPGGMVR